MAVATRVDPAAAPPAGDEPPPYIRGVTGSATAAMRDPDGDRAYRSKARTRRRSTGRPLTRWLSTISGTSAALTPPYQTPSG